MSAPQQNQINPNSITQTWLNVNSNSISSFNSIVTFDINQTRLINEIYILSIGGITGVPVQLLPCAASALKFITTVNYLYQGSILNTVPAGVNYINKQIANDDQDRIFVNTAAGIYSSQSERFAQYK